MPLSCAKCEAFITIRKKAAEQMPEFIKLMILHWDGNIIFGIPSQNMHQRAKKHRMELQQKKKFDFWHMFRMHEVCSAAQTRSADYNWILFSLFVFALSKTKNKHTFHKCLSWYLISFRLKFISLSKWFVATARIEHDIGIRHKSKLRYAVHFESINCYLCIFRLVNK